MVRHLIGLVAFVATFGLLGYALRRLRRVLLPAWTGASGLLIDLLGVAVVVTGVTQTLALLGLYRWWAVIPTYVAVAALLTSFASSGKPAEDGGIEPAAEPLLGSAGNALAALAIGLGLGPWLVRAVEGLTGGVPGADTLWYHLPSAMRLVQTGSSNPIPHFDAGNLTAFFPQASTYFHATGMMFLGSDILSPLVNLSWAALALLAGWVIGRPRGISPLTLLAAAVAVSFPGFVGHQGGSAMNDIVVFALVLGAIAILANANVTRLTHALPLLALAAAATGIALGTKWTALPATGAVTLAVLAIADAGRRVRTAALWLCVSGSFGLFTYLRNWLVVGNPLPAREISIGPITFDAVVPEGEGTGSIAEWITDGRAWDAVFAPGLRLWFGPLWVAALVAMALGLVGAMVVCGRLYRLTAFVGLAALIGYLISPQNLVFLGLPQYFVSNLRYGIVALGLGLILVPIVLVSPRFPAGSRRARAGVALLVLAPLLATSMLAQRTWTGVDDWRYQEYIGRGDTVAGLVAAGLLIGVALLVALGADRLRPHARPLGVGVLLVAMVALAVGRSPYLDRRYARAPFATPARSMTDARIAIDGINTQFQLSGPDLSNHVQWLGSIDDGVFHEVESCREWVQLVNQGEYTHAFFGSTPSVIAGPYAWASADPAAQLVRDFDPGAEFATAFFALDGPLDPAVCAS